MTWRANHCPMCGEHWNGEKCGVCGWYEPEPGVSNDTHQRRIVLAANRRNRKRPTPPQRADEESR